MGRFRQILLPLTLILTAVLIFELGVRYGATNVRAVALAAQLQTHVNFHAHTANSSDSAAIAKLESIIDHHIATAAVQRDHWLLRLKKEPKATLDKALRNGLLMRGDDVVAYFNQRAKIDSVPASKEQLRRIRSALDKARRELDVSN